MIKNRTSAIIFTTILLLVGIGLVAIYSASSYSASKNYGDAFFFVKKQAAGFFAGLALMIFCIFVKTELLKKLRWVILIFSYILLALVFIPGIGLESYGAKRWISLGFVTLQPSEIAKFGLVIFIASYLDERNSDKWKRIIPVLCAGGIMCALIMLEPNMSITVCTLTVTVIMILVGGMSWKKLAVLGAPLIAAAVFLILSEPYRLDRLMAYLDPWASPKDEGYQLIQSYYAIGSGGVFGVGLFNSRQKYLFLPFAESDFIFSIICEETGFFGALGVIAVFMTLIAAGVVTALRARNHFESYLAVGLTSVIAVQTVLNIAVVSGSIPPTGLPLPFISAGGSALAVFMGAGGLLINISNRRNSHKESVLHKI